MQLDSEITTALMYASFKMADSQSGLVEDMRIAIAEPVQLSLEKRDVRSQNDCSDEEKKDALEDRQETADNSQYNKKPSKDMSVNFFYNSSFHLINKQILR